MIAERANAKTAPVVAHLAKILFNNAGGRTRAIFYFYFPIGIEVKVEIEFFPSILYGGRTQIGFLFLFLGKMAFDARRSQAARSPLFKGRDGGRLSSTFLHVWGQKTPGPRIDKGMCRVRV